MQFKINHGTSNRYYLTVNNNPAPFAQMFENKHNSREKDPELVAACRLVKAAPKLLEALEKAGHLIEQMAQAIGASDEYGDFAGEIESAEEFAGELINMATDIQARGEV